MLTFTKSMLALSVMAAVGGANAATYTVDTTLTDKIFTEGIVAINGATVTVAGDEITGKLFKARERQKFCVHGIIGARQTGASNEHEHQTQFS